MSERKDYYSKQRILYTIGSYSRTLQGHTVCIKAITRKKLQEIPKPDILALIHSSL